MTNPTVKEEIVRMALGLFDAQIDTMRAAAAATQAGATHEESKAENDKDTRGLEASYLARGQAARVEELQESRTRLERMALRTFAADSPIELSALVTLLVDDEERHYFLVPAGGGLRMEGDGLPAVLRAKGVSSLYLITPKSPLGLALFGKQEGDDFTLRVAGGLREIEVASIQ